MKYEIEPKSDVFYVRCRPNVKKVLVDMMKQDGFGTMSDWFEQFIQKVVNDKKRRKTK